MCPCLPLPAPVPAAQPHRLKTHPSLPPSLLPLQSGTPRRLELVVTGVMLRIEQPWSVEEGKWAPWLNVELTLTQKPTKTLVGALGATLPATTGAWQARKGVISFAPLVRRRAAA